MGLLQDLKRRHVILVAAGYAGAAMLVLAAAWYLAQGLSLPAWFFPVVATLTIAGFPLVLVLSWAYQLTPERVRRASPAPAPSAAAEAPPARATPAPALPPSPKPVLTASPPSGPITLAALPFTNLTSDPLNEYFSDGMSDAILARLSQLSGLRVISLAAALRHGAKQPPRAVAAELGASHILEGSVRRAGGRVRITAALTEAATDTPAWADSYDRELADVCELQSDLATALAGALRVRSTQPEHRRLARRDTSDVDAYDYFLRAEHLVARPNSPNLASALELYQQAVTRDPRFALAYARLAAARLFSTYWGRVSPAAVLEPAAAEVRRALELDPELGEAHCARAELRLYADHDWAGAESAVERSIALRPSNPAAYQLAGTLRLLWGRYDEALERLETALRFDPHAGVLLSYRGHALIYAGRLEEAVQVLRRAVELEPDVGYSHYQLGLALRAQERNDEALAEFQRARWLMGDHELPMGSAAATLGSVGRVHEASQLYHELHARRQQEWTDPFALGLAALGVDRIEEAVDEFQRAFTEHSFYAFWIRATLRFPALAPLRQHPRLQRLLLRIWPGEFPGDRPTAGESA